LHERFTFGALDDMSGAKKMKRIILNLEYVLQMLRN